MSVMEGSHTCVLCGEEFEGWGNNPEPLAAFEDGRACDTCNETKVIPERLGRMDRNQDPRQVGDPDKPRGYGKTSEPPLRP